MSKFNEFRFKSRSAQAIIFQRIVIRVLLAAHGWARLLSDAVTPFGVWLENQGFPMDRNS